MQSCGILKHSTITVTGSINGGGLDDADDWDFDAACDEQMSYRPDEDLPPEEESMEIDQFVSTDAMLAAIRGQSQKGPSTQMLQDELEKMIEDDEIDEHIATLHSANQSSSSDQAVDSVLEYKKKDGLCFFVDH